MAVTSVRRSGVTLFAACALSIGLVVCGCSEGQPDAGNALPDVSIDVSVDEVDQTRAVLARRFVDARVEIYGDDAARGTKEFLITDEDRVADLLSHFPEAGLGFEALSAAGSEAFGKIAFVRADGTEVTVSVDDELKTWSEGKGDWDIHEPERLKAYLFGLLRPDANDRATIASFVDQLAQGGDDTSAWRRSTGDDSYRPLLAIRTNDFSGDYEVGQPIPVAVEIRNLRPQGDEKGVSAAQLFPHLDAWIRSRNGRVLLHERFEPTSENYISIKPGETFVALLDVREVLELNGSGEYRVSVGHENFVISNMSDWIGTLASKEHVIRIHAKAAEP